MAGVKKRNTVKAKAKAPAARSGKAMAGGRAKTGIMRGKTATASGFQLNIKGDLLSRLKAKAKDSGGGTVRKFVLNQLENIAGEANA